MDEEVIDFIKIPIKISDTESGFIYQLYVGAMNVTDNPLYAVIPNIIEPDKGQYAIMYQDGSFAFYDDLEIAKNLIIARYKADESFKQLL